MIDDKWWNADVASLSKQREVDMEEGYDYRQVTMTAEEYAAALFLDSIEEA